MEKCDWRFQEKRDKVSNVNTEGNRMDRKVIALDIGQVCVQVRGEL